jgi:hypothetical protein
MEFGSHVELEHGINKTTLDFFDRFAAAEKTAARTGSN